MNILFYNFDCCTDNTLLILQGSRDNMSVVIIAFPNAPKVDEEAKQREAKLDSLIEEKVSGNHYLYIYSSYSLCNFS